MQKRRNFMLLSLLFCCHFHILKIETCNSWFHGISHYYHNSAITLVILITLQIIWIKMGLWNGILLWVEPIAFDLMCDYHWNMPVYFFILYRLSFISWNLSVSLIFSICSFRSICIFMIILLLAVQVKRILIRVSKLKLGTF